MATEETKKKAKMKTIISAPSRQQGIIVTDIDESNCSYAAIAKKLKDNVDLEAIGVRIGEIIRTKTRAISLSVGKVAERALAAEKLKATVDTVLSQQ
jgi:hypothetical protein